MSDKIIINRVGENITVTLTGFSGQSSKHILINNGGEKKIFYGSGENDKLKKLTLNYSNQWTGEETEITYEVNIIGQGIDRVFNDYKKLYLEQYGESAFRVRLIGRN